MIAQIKITRPANPNATNPTYFILYQFFVAVTKNTQDKTRGGMSHNDAEVNKLGKAHWSAIVRCPEVMTKRESRRRSEVLF